MYLLSRKIDVYPSGSHVTSISVSITENHVVLVTRRHEIVLLEMDAMTEDNEKIRDILEDAEQV